MGLIPTRSEGIQILRVVKGQFRAAGCATHQRASPDRDQGIALSSTPELEAAGGSLRRVDRVPRPLHGFISERSLE